VVAAVLSPVALVRAAFMAGQLKDNEATMRNEHLKSGPDEHPPGTGAPGEIEITPEMIEAGVSIYLGHCPDTGTGDVMDRKMIAEIFQQ
jgi:hypothetical protein